MCVQLPLWVLWVYPHQKGCKKANTKMRYWQRKQKRETLQCLIYFFLVCSDCEVWNIDILRSPPAVVGSVVVWGDHGCLLGERPNYFHWHLPSPPPLLSSHPSSPIPTNINQYQSNYLLSPPLLFSLHPHAQHQPILTDMGGCPCNQSSIISGQHHTKRYSSNNLGQRIG